MHFLTQAASGALLLCLAPHIESPIYPETFISAARAGTVDRANNTTNNFIFAPCDRISENNRLRSCTPRSASWQGPRPARFDQTSSDWKCFGLGLVAHGLNRFHLRLGNFFRVAADHLIRRFGRCPFLCFLFGRLVLRRRLTVVGADEVGTTDAHFLDQVGAAAFRAFLGYRLGVRSEVALRIIGTAVEHVAPPGFTFCNVSTAAGGALHPFNNVLLDVCAFRLAAAGDDLSILAITQH